MKRAIKPNVTTLPVTRATVIPLSGTATGVKLARKLFRALSIIQEVQGLMKTCVTFLAPIAPS